MKKILLTLFVVFSLHTTSNAQALIVLLFGDKLSTETFQMGINASLSASTINGLNDMLKDNTGNAWNNSIFLLSISIPVGASSDSKEKKK